MSFMVTGTGRVRYHRLTHEDGIDEEAEEERAFRMIRNLSRSRKSGVRKRLKVRIPSLRKFFIRRRIRLFTKVKVSWRKSWKRLKNGQVYMNDLFRGNFLTMQFSSAPFCCETPSKGPGLGRLPPKPVDRIG